MLSDASASWEYSQRLHTSHLALHTDIHISIETDTDRQTCRQSTDSKVLKNVLKTKSTTTNYQALGFGGLNPLSCFRGPTLWVVGFS